MSDRLASRRVKRFVAQLEKRVRAENRQYADPTVEQAKAMLDAVRKRADGWRNGVAGTFAVILASLAIKPGEGFMKYEGDTRKLLMVLIGLSLSSALFSLYRLVRAANGPTWLAELTGAEATNARFLRRAAGARADLQLGQFAWWVSLLSFSVAVGVTWFAELP
jgi:hypothetical protein